MGFPIRSIGPGLFCSLLCSCSTGVDDTAFESEVINGVTHVRNLAPQWGEEPRVGLELVRQIGGLGETDERYLFYSPSDVAVDDEGNIYVLDAGTKEVKIYDSDGEYVATFGRVGQGPGEFNSLPAAMNIGADGEVFIHEDPPSRMHTFAQDRTFLDRILFPRAMHYRFALLGPDKFCMSHSDIEEQLEFPDSLEAFLVGIYDRAGQMVHEFCEPLLLEDHRLTVAANRHALEVDSEGNIYVAFYHQNRIDKYSSDGTHLLRVDRPLNYEITYDMGTRELEMFGQIREFPYVIATRVAKGFGIDHENRLWVPTFVAQPEEGEQNPEKLVFQIFDAGGVWLGSLPTPRYFTDLRIRRSQLFLLDDENTAIYQFSIEER